jgi:diguanylate cyclase (GGDEF)-like protein
VIPSLDLLPSGCIVTSLARVVHFTNAYFQNDLGFDLSALDGQPLDVLLTPASRIFYETFLHPTLLTEGQCSEASLTLISGQGKRVPIVANVRLLAGKDPLVIWSIMRAENREKIYDDLRKARETLQANAVRLERLASTDALTGLPNRRDFETKVVKDIKAADQFGLPIAVVMIDIGNFKSFNDTYGHAVGDEVLRKFAYKLATVVKSHERIARYGGEEFICSLNGADAADAQAFAERVRDAVGSIPVKGRRLSVSIGISVRPPKSGLDVYGVTTFADLALYEAKSTGRDRVVFYSDAVGAKFYGKSSNIAIVRPALRVVS